MGNELGAKNSKPLIIIDPTVNTILVFEFILCLHHQDFNKLFIDHMAQDFHFLAKI